MWILVIALLLLVAFYVMYYYKVPATLTILQTTLQDFHFDMLREKQPIVLQDRVADIDHLRRLWFKWNFTTPFKLTPNADLTWIRNKYKYLILQADEDCEVFLASASERMEDGTMPDSATLVAVQLAAKQCVIVPFRMYYAVSKQNSAIGVHDLVTQLLP
jgi:hypothetical protein